jgi:hypothetical protein
MNTITLHDDISLHVKEFTHIVAGVWGFNDRVSPEELIDYAFKWKGRQDASRYLDLHVRGISKTTFGIGFKYHVEQNDPHHVVYKARISAELKEHFGENFLGCNLSQPIWQIL